MRVLVTGSAGHLGEALVRTLRARGHEARGIDLLASPWTDATGSIADRAFVAEVMRGMDAVVNAATLHKPHVATHDRQAFVDVNVTGTLALLDEAVRQGIRRFVFTSTTSVFGHALTPAKRAPATWITEDVAPIPKNIYGATKLAAETLCELAHRESGLPCIVLRTSRFFPEDDDMPERRDAYDADNLKVNELLYRRGDIEDMVEAHLAALERAPAIGFGRYIVSATTPFSAQDLALLPTRPAEVVARHVPAYEAEFARRGWKMLAGIDRVYVNAAARRDLAWTPRSSFASAIERLARGEDYRSDLTREVGSKGYHRATA